MKRILVIGNSGAGKSTLAKQLSERLKLPFFPSDGFYWEPGWIIASQERVHRQVREVIAQEAWILDGNFDEEHEFVWRQADCIIWLDYSFLTILTQILWRNFKWTLTRQPTWAGNIMTSRRALSGVQHAVTSYSSKKQSYPNWLAELSGITCHRFCKKQETDAWLRGLNH